jgi:hypothetical protein
LVLQNVRYYYEFICTDNSPQCNNEQKYCEDTAVEQTAATHHVISEDQESDGAEKVDTPESGTRMLGNLFLNYNATASREDMKTVLKRHLILVLHSFRCSHSTVHGKVHSTDYSNITNC